MYLGKNGLWARQTLKESAELSNDELATILGGNALPSPSVSHVPVAIFQELVPRGSNVCTLTHSRSNLLRAQAALPDEVAGSSRPGSLREDRCGR